LNSNPIGGRRTRGYLITLAAASAVILVLLLYSLGEFSPPAATSSSSTTTATSYAVDAASVISSAASRAPAGYAEGSSQQLSPREPGLESAGYAVLSSQAGSLANLTVLVFDGPDSAQTYGDSVVANAKGLVGYTEVTPVLSSYPHYGLCYGYGEDDPDGNGSVATGVCTRGNVYIQVHLVSHSPLATASREMAGLVGAAYGGVG
jgi:hypothetical protein